MTSYLEALDRLSVREKVMLGVMGVAIFSFVVFLGVFLVGSRLADMEDALVSKRASLKVLMDNKDAYLERQAAGGSADHKKQIDGNDLNLTTFADQHAKAVGIKFDDYNDSKRPLFLKKRAVGVRGEEKPDLIEEQLEVTFKRAGLRSVTAFLDRVDKETRRPIAIKKLSLKALWSDREKLNGSITMATWKNPEEEVK